MPCTFLLSYNLRTVKSSEHRCAIELVLTNLAQQLPESFSRKLPYSHP